MSHKDIQLFERAEAGRAAEVRHLLGEGAVADGHKNEDGSTALNHASYNRVTSSLVVCALMYS